MQLATTPGTDQEWLANFQEVQSRTSVLIAKSTGSGGHTASMTTGDPVIDRWEEWVRAGAPYEETSAAPDAGVPADAGPFSDASSGTITWNSSIRQILIDDGCTGCHGLQGAYSLETYNGALGFGTDQSEPNVVPGNASSLLITYYDDSEHHASLANAELVRRWIVDNDAAEE